MNWRVATRTGGIPSRRIAARSSRNGVTSTSDQHRQERQAVLGQDRRRRPRPARAGRGRDAPARPSPRGTRPARGTRAIGGSGRRGGTPESPTTKARSTALGRQDPPPADRGGDHRDDEGQRRDQLRAGRRAGGAGRRRLAVPLQDVKPHRGRSLPGPPARDERPGQAQPDPEDHQRPDHPGRRRRHADSIRAEQARHLVVGDRRRRSTAGRISAAGTRACAPTIFQPVGVLRGERGEEDRHRQRDRQARQRPTCPHRATGAGASASLGSSIRSGRVSRTNRRTSPVISASPRPIAAWTRAIQPRTAKNAARPPEAASSTANAPEARSTENQAATIAPIRTPARPPIARRIGGVDRIAADRADQPHVDEVRPQGRQAAVAEEEALDDQDRGDHHRARPGAEHHRRQDPAQQVARDRHGPDREVDHLRREDERRHRPHQHGRPLAELPARAAASP